MTSATVYASYGEKLKVSTFATPSDRGAGVSVLITIEGVTIHVCELEELDILAAIISEARLKFMAEILIQAQLKEAA